MNSQNSDGLIQRISRLLSVLTCKYFFDGFDGIEELQIKDKEVEAYIFEGFYAGYNPLWGDLLINEILLEDGMEEALKKIVIHENIHSEESKLGLLFIGSFQILLYPPIMMIAFLLLVLTEINLLFNPDFLNPISTILNKEIIYAILIAYPISGIISTTSELMTELSVLDKMGKDSYLQASNKISDAFPEPGIIGRISLKLSHPSPEFVVKVKEFFRKDSSV